MKPQIWLKNLGCLAWKQATTSTQRFQEVPTLVSYKDHFHQDTCRTQQCCDQHFPLFSRAHSINGRVRTFIHIILVVSTQISALVQPFKSPFLSHSQDFARSASSTSLRYWQCKGLYFSPVCSLLNCSGSTTSLSLKCPWTFTISSISSVLIFIYQARLFSSALTQLSTLV